MDEPTQFDPYFLRLFFIFFYKKNSFFMKIFTKSTVQANWLRTPPHPLGIAGRFLPSIFPKHTHPE